MDRQLAAAGMRVVGAAERAEEDLVRGHAEGKRDRHVAVVEPRRVLPGADGGGDADLRNLVAARGEDEVGLALAGEDPQSLVHSPSENGDVVDPAQTIHGSGSILSAGVFFSRRGPRGCRGRGHDGQRKLEAPYICVYVWLALRAIFAHSFVTRTSTRCGS